MLKERIDDIAEGSFENEWPVMPVEPTDEDLDNPFLNSKRLWSIYSSQMSEYAAAMHRFKEKLKFIDSYEISSRARRRAYQSLNSEHASRTDQSNISESNVIDVTESENDSSE